VSDSIIYGNTIATIPLFSGPPAVSYSDLQVSTSGTGNISQDPLFTTEEGLNYILGMGSPCIDSGLTVIDTANPANNYFDPALSLSDPPNKDTDLAAFPAKGKIATDMGAYGGPGAGSIGTYTTTDNPSTEYIKEDVIGAFGPFGPQ